MNKTEDLETQISNQYSTARKWAPVCSSPGHSRPQRDFWKEKMFVLFVRRMVCKQLRPEATPR